MNLRTPVLWGTLFLFWSHGLAAEGPGADWPSFRGPERSGLAGPSGLRAPWPEAGLQPLWSRPLGEGYSAVSVAEGRLYTLYAEGEKEYLVSLDPADGHTLWQVELGQKVQTEFGNGPRSTPAVAGDTVYAVGSDLVLRAVATADGKERWRVDLGKEFGAQPPRWGFATSPLVDGDLVLLEVGGGEGKGIAALDAATGKTRWTALNSRTSYGSPIAVTLGGVRQYITAPSGAPQVVGLSTTGEVLWSHEWSSGTIAMPLLVDGDKVFVSASEDVGGMLFQVRQVEGKFTTEELWRNREMKNHFSSTLVYGGYLYGFDGATLKCLDAATGERKWVKRGFGKGSLIAADDHLLVLTDRGQLVLVEATPEEYRQAGSFPVLEDKTWTAPVLAAGKLYLRDHAKLVCFDVTAGGAQAGGAS